MQKMQKHTLSLLIGIAVKVLPQEIRESVPGARTPSHADSIISLRLLALILCSNCSNTFNKVLMPKWHHTVKLLFANSVHHFSLLKMCHGWSKHFTSRYDPSTPHTTPHPTSHKNSTTSCNCTQGGRRGRQVTAVDRKGLLRWPERCGGRVTSFGFLLCFTFYTLPRSLTELRQSSVQFRKAEKLLVATEAKPRGRKSTWKKIRAQTLTCARLLRVCAMRCT